MMSVIQMQVWEAERRLEENRGAAHRSRIVAMAQEARKNAQRSPQRLNARKVNGTLFDRIQQAYLSSVISLVGYPPSHAA